MADGLIVPAAFDATIHDKGRPRTSVQSVIPTTTITTDSFVYLVETIRNVQADVVAPAR